MRLSLVAGRTVAAAACLAASLTVGMVEAAPPKYSYFVVGDPADVRTPGQPQVCQPRTPLTYRDIPVYKVTGSATFNINSWSGAGGVSYFLSAKNGVLTSTQAGGNIY